MNIKQSGDVCGLRFFYVVNRFFYKKLAMFANICYNIH